MAAWDRRVAVAEALDSGSFWVCSEGRAGRTCRLATVHKKDRSQGRPRLLT